MTTKDCFPRLGPQVVPTGQGEETKEDQASPARAKTNCFQKRRTGHTWWHVTQCLAAELTFSLQMHAGVRCCTLSAQLSFPQLQPIDLGSSDPMVYGSISHSKLLKTQKTFLENNAHCVLYIHIACFSSFSALILEVAASSRWRQLHLGSNI